MRHVVASVASAGMVAAVASAQVTWDGDCGNALWHSTCRMGATNWSPDGLPQSGDTVVLGPTDPAVTIMGLIGNVAQISCVGDLVITNGGQLMLHGTGGTVANLILTNSSVVCATPNTSLLLAGNSVTDGGALHGPGQMKNVAGISGLSLTLNGVNGAASFINNGSASLSSIPIELGCSFTNSGGATLTLVPNQQLSGGSVSGAGVLTNGGTFVTQHNGTPFSTFVLNCDYVQTGGAFQVKGQSTNAGTRIASDSIFSGGTIDVQDQATLRFGQFGVAQLNGLVSITGAGNVYLQLSASPGPEWRVESPLTVSMSGSDGFVLETGRLMLSSTLTNLGRATWSGMTIRGLACPSCQPRFVNASFHFTIDTGAASNAVTLDAPFDNALFVEHVQGHLFLDDGATFTNYGIHTLGAGGIERLAPAIESEYVNRGLVLKPKLVADSAGASSSTLSAVFRHEEDGQLTVLDGTIEVTFGALRLNGGAITVVEPGVIQLTGGVSRAEALSDTLISGTGRFAIVGPQPRLRAEGGNVVFAVTGLAPNGVHLSGGIGGSQGSFANQADLHWSGGTIGIDDGKGTVSGFLENQGNVFLSSGTIAGDLSAFANGAAGPSDDDSLAGAGLVGQTGPLNIAAPGGHADNAGVWEVSAGGAMLLGTGTFFNASSGHMIVVPPADQATVFSARYSNAGLTEVKSGTLFVAQPLNLAGGTLEGGTWLVQPGATLDFPGPISVIGSTTDLVAYGDVPDLEQLTQNHGDLVIRAGSFFLPLINEGTLSFNPTPGEPTEAQQPTVNGTDGYLEETFVPSLSGNDVPIALVTPQLTNHGTIAPGGTGAAGPFAIEGDVVQSATGTLRVELGGATPITEHDQLVVIGDVALDGALRIDLLPGYQPVGGEEFTVVATEAGAIAGAFDEISGPGQFSLAYATNSVTLTLKEPPVFGDLNNDGEVGAADLAILLGAWGACEPLAFCDADLDHDENVGATDLAMVLGAWG